MRGVFSIFDLNADSSDLINSDFFVGLPISARYGPLSAQVRVFHQSSHLGDEFLLRGPVDRINLSYEGADLRLSVKPWNWLRFYAGGVVRSSTPNRISMPGWCKAASRSRARTRSTLISSTRSWRSMFSRSRNRIGRSTIRRAPVLKCVGAEAPSSVTLLRPLLIELVGPCSLRASRRLILPRFRAHHKAGPQIPTTPERACRYARAQKAKKDHANLAVAQTHS